MENLKRIKELMDRPPTLHELLEGAAIPIVSVDSRGYIISLNRRAEVFFGNVNEELFGHPMRELFHEDVTLVTGQRIAKVAARDGAASMGVVFSFVDIGIDRIWAIQFHEKGSR